MSNSIYTYKYFLPLKKIFVNYFFACQIVTYGAQGENLPDVKPKSISVPKCPIRPPVGLRIYSIDNWNSFRISNDYLNPKNRHAYCYTSIEAKAIEEEK